MERKIIEYMIVGPENSYVISCQVTQKLKEGWEIYGGSAMATDEDSVWCTQPMVKYAEEEDG